MKLFKKTLLIIDDQIVNRLLLHKILDASYTVLEADGGEKGLAVLKKHKDLIQVILLDLIMPGMDGYTFLEIIKKDPELKDIPVIVTTQSEGVEVEIKALELGAADFVTKPYNNTVVSQRVTNIIALRENSILRNTSERDPLTGLYNKETFYKKVPEMVEAHPFIQFAILYANIEHFKIVNDFFGAAEGDKLLCYIAKTLSEYADPKLTACCRHHSDIFVVCMPFTETAVEMYVKKVSELFDAYPLKLRLAVNFGVYLIEDIENIPVHVMCDRASLALANVVGKYDENCAYYDDSHRNKLVEEQAISNDMGTALKEGQFQVYLQPKFDLRDFSITGAETLIRWLHPVKGMIAPDKFVPVLERNGFITDVDFFVWDKACQHIRKWLDNGWPAVPVSINVSRVDIYRPDICDVFDGLLEKYNLPSSLLELEITETAYTQDADQLIDVVTELKNRGFRISMDDFGAGYSSLNMLNEVPVDVLKIDMKFLRNIDARNKSSNIIGFIVSMAKWLDLGVICEGVETLEHVKFLRSIGCHKGQGYFFAKPLPIALFEEKLVSHQKEDIEIKEAYSVTKVHVDELVDPHSHFSMVFNLVPTALILLELRGDNLSILRANDEFYKKIIANSDEFYSLSANLMPSLSREYQDALLDVLHRVADTKEDENIEIQGNFPDYDGLTILRLDVRILHYAEESSIFMAYVNKVFPVNTPVEVTSKSSLPSTKKVSSKAKNTGKATTKTTSKVSAKTVAKAGAKSTAETSVKSATKTSAKAVTTKTAKERKTQTNKEQIVGIFGK